MPINQTRTLWNHLQPLKEPVLHLEDVIEVEMVMGEVEDSPGVIKPAENVIQMLTIGMTA